jgi:hypothetical protein
MSALLKAVSDFPVIVQGALGSALFALFLFGGQKLAASVRQWVASWSDRNRRRYLTEEVIRYNAIVNTEYATRAAFVSLLLLRALRSLLKGLLWLTFGLIGGTVDSILGVVGYLGTIYYLFLGLSTVAPTGRSSDPRERLAEIRKELKSLKKEKGEEDAEQSADAT